MGFFMGLVIFGFVFGGILFLMMIIVIIEMYGWCGFMYILVVFNL